METPQLLACLAAAAPAASLPRSCATWLPWNRSGPVYTSRSPDLGSSRSLHRQSISGLRRSCSCCRSWFHRASLAILFSVLGLSLVSHVLVVTVLPVVSVLIHWSSLSSHTPHRVSFHSYGVVSAWDKISSLRREKINESTSLQVSVKAIYY